ncbi:MAG: mannosyltransferase, partial [Hyphomicrobiales bacterium]|nr:mannosyltransferase [Hyphomicrobiales bacterium]
WTVSRTRIFGMLAVISLSLLTASGESSRLKSELALFNQQTLPDPFQSESSHLRMAQLAVSDRDDVCGLALIGAPWFASGGYSHFHHDAPIYIYEQETLVEPEAARVAIIWAAFNYAILQNYRAAPTDFSLSQCWGDICVYRRDGPCLDNPENEFSTVLLRHGK